MPQKEVVIDDLKEKETQTPEDQSKQKEPQKGEKYVTLEELEKIRLQNEQLTKQLNSQSYQLRKLGEQIQTFQQPPVQSPPQEPVQQGAKDKWDQLVETNWKEAVKGLASEAYEEKKRLETEIQKQQFMQQKFNNTLFQSQKTVLEKYPDLNDPSSELAQKFVKVLENNQDWKYESNGPLLTMYRMEEELRQEGKLDQYTKKIVDKEVARQARVGATSAPHSSVVSKSESNVLTKEEKELCDFNGIAYDGYLAMKKAQRKEEGVEA